jgi:RHS repeat-associated protein
MARDTISASVQAWYQGAVQPPPSGETPIINDLLSSLTNDVVSSNASEFAGAMSPVSSALSLAMGSFVTTDENSNYVTTAPKAFLNWVEFDDQLNYVNGGVVQVPQITGGQNKQVLQASLPMAMPKNGYVYIYVSNESQDTVYFNNLDINYRRGPVTEEEHYYPFGLTMAGISDQALQFGKWNRYRYNGIELDTSLGLDDYEAKLRDLDPQIGRWWQVDPKAEGTEFLSPYASNDNDPIRLKDPNGDVPCNPCYTLVIEDFIDHSADAADPEDAVLIRTGGTLAIGGAILLDQADANSNVSITGIPQSANQIVMDNFEHSSTAITPVAVQQPVDLSGVNPAVKNQPYAQVFKPMAQAKGETKTAPGQTAAGHPTDSYGNKLGPSGKPQVNNVNHPSQKAAKDAARQEGDGAPVKHPSPTKGGPHYHPTRGGEKIPNSSHHNY